MNHITTTNCFVRMTTRSFRLSRRKEQQGGMRIARYPSADWTASTGSRSIRLVVVVVALPFVPPLSPPSVYRWRR